LKILSEESKAAKHRRTPQREREMSS